MRIEPRMGMDLRVSTWVLQNFWLENPHLKCMIRGYHGLDFLWFFRARIQPPFRAQERGGERRDLRAVVRAPRAQRVSMAMGLPQLDGSKSGKSYENLDDFLGYPHFRKPPCGKWLAENGCKKEMEMVTSGIGVTARIHLKDSTRLTRT